MELNKYQNEAKSTCLPTSDNKAYMLFGLGEEVGEVFGKIAKAIRKGWIKVEFEITEACPDDFKDAIAKEFGDVEWMLSGAEGQFGMTKDEVCQYNLDKLASRKQRGVIDGQGDNR